MPLPCRHAAFLIRHYAIVDADADFLRHAADAATIHAASLLLRQAAAIFRHAEIFRHGAIRASLPRYAPLDVFAV